MARSTRPTAGARDARHRAAGRCVRRRESVGFGGAERGRRPLHPPTRPAMTPSAAPSPSVTPSLSAGGAPGRDARRRGRRPGHRSAGHVHLGRRRLGQPVASGLADRRRHRRAPDGLDRRSRRGGHLVRQTDPRGSHRRLGGDRSRNGWPADRLRRPGGRVVVGPGDRGLRRRSRLGHVLLARDRAMSHGIGVAHLPRRCQPRTGHTDDRAAPGAPVAPCSSWPASASSAPARTGHRRPSRLPMACSRSSRMPTARPSSAGMTAATSPPASRSPRARRPGSIRAWPGVLAATLADGTTQTSDPLHLGKKLKWRAVKAVGPNGAPDRGPDTFASWEPGGGRYATLSGDLATGDDVRVVLIDPSVSTTFEIPLDRSVVAAPPAWIDKDRFVVVTGDAAEPTATIVDAQTGELSDGPAGARLIATSADGRRIATMAGQGAPVVVRDTTAWLGDDGSSLASIEPAGDATTAIGFALDSTGQRLVDRLGRPQGRRHPRHPRRPSRLAPRRPTRDRPRPRRRRLLDALAVKQARDRGRPAGVLRNRESRRADGAGEGGAEHRSERTSRCVSEERRRNARPRRPAARLAESGGDWLRGCEDATPERLRAASRRTPSGG